MWAIDNDPMASIGTFPPSTASEQMKGSKSDKLPI